jgi:hypothetical protein
LCFDTVEYDPSWGEGYAYPEPYQGNLQYISPARFLDLSAVAAEEAVASNFVLSEFMQYYKGPYGIFSPEVVAQLQLVRTDMGAPLNVSSAYRNVTYNADVGGVAHSRHMYGDAVDLYGSSTSLETIQALCEAHGAYFTSLYETHVHCDWREPTLEPAFFDAGISSFRSRAAEGGSPAVSAEVLTKPWGFVVEPAGFDEGAPQIDWFVYGAAGELLGTWQGAELTPPVAAEQIEVVVGGILHLSVFSR